MQRENVAEATHLRHRISLCEILLREAHPWRREGGEEIEHCCVEGEFYLQ